MRRAIPVLLALLLAGCSGDDGGGGQASDAASMSTAAPLNATQVQLRFDATDAEATHAEDLAIPVGETCMPFMEAVPCTSRRTVDLTALVPPDVPVQLAYSVDDDAQAGAFVSSFIEIEQGTVTYQDDDEDNGGDETVVVIIMEPGGTVHLVVEQYFTGLPPQSTTLQVAARSVVRPDVVPSYLPVSVDLEAGDVLLAAGDGLEDFVVVPPGGAAIHHLGPFEYNATSGGRHIVIAEGQGDIKLFGPPGTALKALIVQETMGTPHEVPSGQDVTWEFTVDGVPLYVGFVIQTVDAAGAGFAVGAFHGNFRVAIERLGATLLEVDVDDCTLPIQCGFNLVGGSDTRYYSEHLHEGLGPGSYGVSARFETASGYTVSEVYGFVVP